MYCLKTYIGQIIYGPNFEHCAGSNGDGVDISCKDACTQFCSSIHDVARRKHEVIERWGLSKDETRKINKEL